MWWRDIAVVFVQIGKGVVRRGGKDVALVAYGTMVNNALAAAEMLAKSGVTATVADMRCEIIRHLLCAPDSSMPDHSAFMMIARLGVRAMEPTTGHGCLTTGSKATA